MNNRRLRPSTVLLLQATGLTVFALAVLFILSQPRVSSEASSAMADQPTGTADVRATLVAATQTAAADRIARWTPPPPWTVVPRPTATALPDRGVRASSPQELAIQNQLKTPNAPSSFFPTSADAKTVVGVARIGGKDVIAAIDISSNQVRVLSEEPCYSPEVFGKYVVWTKSPGLYVYDMEQGRTKSIESVAGRDARISGTVVVWERYDVGKDTQPGMWGYDLATNRAFPIATQPELFEEAPEISGEWVVYYGKTGKHPMGELRAANVRTRENIYLGQIFTGSKYVPMPQNLYAIDIPWVAWGTGEFGKTPEFHLYNLETRKTSTVRLSPHGPNQIDVPASNFRISKGVVIFSCGYNCYMGYHIRRNAFFTIPIQQPKTEDDSLMRWVLAGDQIVWTWRANVNGREENRVSKSQIISSPEPPPYP